MAQLSMPGDALERQADTAADQVMRQATPHGSGDALATVQPHHLTARSGALPAALRAVFEPAFGHDFSDVRVHADGAAAAAAQSVQARAYTQGHDIVFGAGEYAPTTRTGQSLLAHELAHVVQQERGQAGGVQRKLSVDKKGSDDPATAVATIQPLVAALCPDFTVAAGGLVSPKPGSDSAGFKFAKVAAGKRKLGCCCLSTLTAAPDAWTIVVRSAEAPTTDQGLREVAMAPTSGPLAPELRYWSGAAPTQTVQALPMTEAFGHELCGHAALMQIKAHPSSLVGAGDRAYDDEHDPTVRVENALAIEMGLGGARRGLAASGSHRGESLRVFTIGPYAADADDPAPFAAQLGVAIAFLDGNDGLLVDEVGLRGKSDTLLGVGLSRATKVRAALTKGMKKASVEVETTPGKNETLPRVQPATDGGVGASPVVELVMAIRPAGLIKPIGKAPPATPVHLGPEFPAVVKTLKAGKGPNACHNLLASTGWP